jgi:hypothetical protein
MNKKTKKIIIVFLYIVISIPFMFLGYVATRILADIHDKFTWEESDWNDDGQTTISEYLRGMDMGKRKYRADKDCIEYFDYKAGQTYKVDCIGEGAPFVLDPDVIIRHGKKHKGAIPQTVKY